MEAWTEVGHESQVYENKLYKKNVLRQISIPRPNRKIRRVSSIIQSLQVSKLPGQQAIPRNNEITKNNKKSDSKYIKNINALYTT